MVEADRIVTMSRYIELSRSEVFQNFFIDEMIFPESAVRPTDNEL